MQTSLSKHDGAKILLRTVMALDAQRFLLADATGLVDVGTILALTQLRKLYLEVRSEGGQDWLGGDETILFLS